MQELVSFDEAITAVSDAFRALATGDAAMPGKVYLSFPRHGGDLRVMPASLGMEFGGVKVVNSHPGNAARGLPVVVGTYLLIAQETGMPLAIMGATHLTAIRTGAASAVATRHLARGDASTVGLVGSGTQAGFQVEALTRVMRIDEVLVWAPQSDIVRRDLLIDRLKRRHPAIRWTAVDDVRGASRAAVVCTTTPSMTPVVMDDWVSPGAHINAVGADGPGKQELDPRILKRARVVVDDWSQATHGGEVNVPLASGEIDEADIDGTLGDVLVGKTGGRSSDEEVTLFDSTGLAIQDMAVASLVYQRAVDTGRGRRFSF